MKIDIERVVADISDELWELSVTIPRISSTLSCSEVELQVGSLLEVAPDNKTNDRNSLVARDSKTGEFICRIALDVYIPTEQGFVAEGTGYLEEIERRKGRKAKEHKSDTYLQGIPATQFWRAVRMGD